MRSKPNIIYILTDDMGYGDVSALNKNAAFSTPSMNQMAKDGMIFSDAHASSAVCTPSRYTILTGRYNWRSRLKWGVISGYGKPIIEPGRKTVADMLKLNGYRTAIIGKWHLGMSFTSISPTSVDPDNLDAREDIDFSVPINDSPTSYGFDYFYGISGSLDMPPYVYIENDRFTHLPTRETENSGKGFWRRGPTAPDFEHEQVLPKLTDKVIEKIGEYQNSDQPFFIYFPMPAPHTPILPTEEFRGKSGTNEYGDFVLECDAMVGKILEKLKAANLYEDTIVIFTSDNGCSPRAAYDELLACGHNPSYVFRGHKYHIYEGGHRVPLIISWPSHIPGGSRCENLVSLGDFMATVADILGYQLPDDMGEDSISNLPMWVDDSSPGTRDSMVNQSWDGSLSIRRDRFKLEMCCDSGGESHPGPRGTYMFPPGVKINELALGADGASRFQLYDLGADISETTNIINDQPEVFEDLKRELTSLIRNGRSTIGMPQKNTGQDVWDAVRWLEE